MLWDLPKQQIGKTSFLFQVGMLLPSDFPHLIMFFLSSPSYHHFLWEGHNPALAKPHEPERAAGRCLSPMYSLFEVTAIHVLHWSSPSLIILYVTLEWKQNLFLVRVARLMPCHQKEHKQIHWYAQSTALFILGLQFKSPLKILSFLQKMETVIMWLLLTSHISEKTAAALWRAFTLWQTPSNAYHISDLIRVTKILESVFIPTCWMRKLRHRIS